MIPSWLKSIATKTKNLGRKTLQVSKQLAKNTVVVATTLAKVCVNGIHYGSQTGVNILQWVAKRTRPQQQQTITVAVAQQSSTSHPVEITHSDVETSTGLLPTGIQNEAHPTPQLSLEEMLALLRSMQTNGTAANRSSTSHQLTNQSEGFVAPQLPATPMNDPSPSPEHRSSRNALIYYRNHLSQYQHRHRQRQTVNTATTSLSRSPTLYQHQETTSQGTSSKTVTNKRSAQFSN